MSLYDKEAKLVAVKEIINVNEKISLLLHETQKERGSSAGFLGSSGLKFKDILLTQREITNKSIEEFKKILNKYPFQFILKMEKL